MRHATLATILFILTLPMTAGEEENELLLTIPGPETVSLHMRRLPAGTFRMGSPEEAGNVDEWPQHEVRIRRPFYMGIFPVTQAQWRAVMGTDPAHFSGNPNHPVERVSWKQCREFLERLNTMGIGRFRLPTEAEWEYACRAGTTTDYYWGDDAHRIGDYAWYAGNSDRRTHPVGLKRPNAWGLYDMSGNVWEWCSDVFAPYAAAEDTDDAAADAGERRNKLPRVLRGGSWSNGPDFCRSAYRFASVPEGRFFTLGFRLVREVEENEDRQP